MLMRSELEYTSYVHPLMQAAQHPTGLVSWPVHYLCTAIHYWVRHELGNIRHIMTHTPRL